MIQTPFPLPTRFHDRLGAIPSSDVWKLDVRVHGKWDGVLVVDREFRVAGILIRGRIEPFRFSFNPEDIEDIRAASSFNRLVANHVSRLFDVLLWFPYVSILAVCPILIVLGKQGFSSAYVVAVIASVFSVMIVGAIVRSCV
jgi:hypothetical protein